MYGGDEAKKCKGVKQSVVKKEITFEDFKTCLFDKKEQIRTMNVIRSHRHVVYTEQVNKIALSSSDDKRADFGGPCAHLGLWTHYSLKF